MDKSKKTRSKTFLQEYHPKVNPNLGTRKDDPVIREKAAKAREVLLKVDPASLRKALKGY